MRVIAIALAFVVSLISTSLAQTWPAHSIRLVVNFPAGGAADLLARSLPVYPPPKALEVSQDRVTEKQFLNGCGIATARFHAIDSQDDLERAMIQHLELAGVQIEARPVTGVGRDTGRARREDAYHRCEPSLHRCRLARRDDDLGRRQA